MFDEFKRFIFKGNVVDLSTGVIIGTAFSGIVKAFTDGIVNPLINLMTGSDKPEVEWMVGALNLGVVISAAINFLIVAAIVFFLIVKPMNKVLAIMKAQEAAAPPAPPAADVVLLAEIRDLLKR